MSSEHAGRLAAITDDSVLSDCRQGRRTSLRVGSRTHAPAEPVRSAAIDDVEPSIYDSRKQNIIQLRGPPNRGHSYYKVGPGVHARRPLGHPGSGEPALGVR